MTATEQAKQLIEAFGNDAFDYAAKNFDAFNEEAKTRDSATDLNGVLYAMQLSCFWSAVCMSICKLENNF